MSSTLGCVESELLADDGKPVVKFEDINGDFGKLVVCLWPLLVLSLGALGFAAFLCRKLLTKKTGKSIDSPGLDLLARKMRSGIETLLREERRHFAAFVVIAALCVLEVFTFAHVDDNEGDYSDGVRCLTCFIGGVFISVAVCYFGLVMAIEGGLRTSVACVRGSLNDGLKTAFIAGGSFSFGVVGFICIGVCLLLMCMKANRPPRVAVQYLFSAGFGVSSVAIFVRVVGGIFTKACTLGADLVEKWEESAVGFDEPRNPVVLGHHVGQSFMGIAGIGSDMLESYLGVLLAAGILGSHSWSRLALPLWLTACGMLASVVGFFLVRTEQTADGAPVNSQALSRSVARSILAANVVFLVLAVVIVILLFGPDSESGWRMYGCIVVGVLEGPLISKGMEYFTSMERVPTKSIKDQARYGPAMVVVQGLSAGMLSTLVPAVVLGAGMAASGALMDSYGIALSGMGMLATFASWLAMGVYGPIAANSAALAEMVQLGPATCRKTDALDDLGKTTAAAGKGFAVGASALCGFSLVAVFRQLTAITKPLVYQVSDHLVLAGVLVGSMAALMFVALMLMSVSKAAELVVLEVHRQLREVTNSKGNTLGAALKQVSMGERISFEEDVEPDSDMCITVMARSSLKEMAAPGLFAVFLPLAAGFLVGPRALVGVLAGCLGTSTILAFLMSSAGTAWTNASRLAKRLKMTTSELTKVFAEATLLGSLLKDGTGPALTTLPKILSTLAVLIAPLVDKDDWQSWWAGIFPVLVILGIVGLLVWFGMLTLQDSLLMDDRWKVARAPTVRLEAFGDRPASSPASSPSGGRLRLVGTTPDQETVKPEPLGAQLSPVHTSPVSSPIGGGRLQLPGTPAEPETTTPQGPGDPFPLSPTSPASSPTGVRPQPVVTEQGTGQFGEAAPTIEEVTATLEVEEVSSPT